MNKNPRLLGVIVFAFAGIALLGIVVPALNDAEIRPLGTPELVYPAPAVEFRTSASDLAKAYQASPLAADTRFKGRTFEVTGAIDYIDTGDGESTFIVLRAGAPFRNPRFRLEPSEQAAAFWLGKGMRVSLICIGHGSDSGTSISRNCVIQR